jgi:hypothetical protein
VAISEPFRYSTVSVRIFLLAAVLAAGFATEANAGKQTVCTITVNSPDEKDVLRRRLPEDQYEFVELVERGRRDWLASACHERIRCDLLVISGHFDGGTEFYSDRLDMRESLPVAELERASCSDSCPGLFSQLKEVYLFGCNTLSGEAGASAFPEVERSLVRAGHSQPDAERLARLLDQRLGESNRDQMRRVFSHVPVIYGFPSKAPLGPIAATHLNRFLESTPAPALGSGRANPKLLGEFAGSSMTVASGLGDSGPQAAHRREVCQFVDDRLSPAEKLGFVHALLRREMADVRLFLVRIESLFASLSKSERQAPAFMKAMGEIALDDNARDRFLRFADDADLPQTRARMIELAGTLGWLTPELQRIELVRMVDDLIKRGSVGSPEVDLICSVNESHALERDRYRLHPSTAQAEKVGNAAALACLGSAQARVRVLKALTSHDDQEVQIAQVYLSHHPITDVDELRVIASGIAHMTERATQVRALDTLARHRLSDRQSLNELARLYPAAGSVDVQRAIAAVFIRADDRAIAKPEVARMLAQYRLKSPDGRDIIDILIRRLRSP